jgi:hypothetical protein
LVAVGLLAWFVARGVPAMIQWIYRLVIMRLGESKRLITAEGLIESGAFTGYVATDDIIKRSGIWPWLAKRAMRSETRRKMGLA